MCDLQSKLERLAKLRTVVTGWNASQGKTFSSICTCTQQQSNFPVLVRRLMNTSCPLKEFFTANSLVARWQLHALSLPPPPPPPPPPPLSKRGGLQDSPSFCLFIQYLMPSLLQCPHSKEQYESALWSSTVFLGSHDTNYFKP